MESSMINGRESKWKPVSEKVRGEELRVRSDNWVSGDSYSKSRNETKN